MKSPPAIESPTPDTAKRPNPAPTQEMPVQFPKNRPRPSTAELSDVLGEPALKGQPLSLADVLPLLDVAGGRCAAVHVAGPVVTGCFDHLIVESQPRHGDVVLAKASIIAVGSRSMLIQIDAFREPQFILPDNGLKHTPVRILRCFSTFVATSLKGPMPMKHIPSSVETKEMMDTFKTHRFVLKSGDAIDLLKNTESCTTLESLKKAQFHKRVPIKATQLVTRKQFLPRHKNGAGIIFGGDILHSLDRAAVACASRLTTCACFTKRIHSLSFLDAVLTHEALEIVATVVAVSEHEALVVVRAAVDKLHDGSLMQPSHLGVFCVAPTLADGAESRFDVGVDLVSDVDHECAEDFLRALAVSDSVPILSDF